MAKPKKVKGQQQLTCCITGCEEKGRALARMGDMTIAYCAKHRKRYGEPIIDALINSVFSYKLSNFLADIRGKLLFSECLCDECRAKVKKMVIEKTEELEALEAYAESNDISHESLSEKGNI